MSKASPSKHHMPKTVRVAQKHLAKPERQSINNTSRKTRPIRSAERREILQRLRTGQAIRKITSELGISHAMVQQIISANNLAYITGSIEFLKLVVEGDKQAAAIQIESMWFSIPAELYAEVTTLIGTAIKERFPVFIIAEWCNENFTVLHVKEAS